jgi:hypothetical protein
METESQPLPGSSSGRERSGQDRMQGKPLGMLEQLLADCLSETGGGIEIAIEAACEKHPELAGTLRDRYRMLLDTGLLDEE